MAHMSYGLKVRLGEGPIMGCIGFSGGPLGNVL